jgi:hypothetical protein
MHGHHTSYKRGCMIITTAQRLGLKRINANHYQMRQSAMHETNQKHDTSPAHKMYRYAIIIVCAKTY